MRSDLSLTEERNFFAGNTLPRLSPLMSGTIHSTSSILWSLIHCSRLTDMRPRLGRGAGPAVDDAAYREVARGARGAVNRLFLPLSALRLPVTVAARSEEHTSALQSLMRISYAVFFCNKDNK